MERLFQASKRQVPSFSVDSHPSVQNRSALHLIYHVYPGKNETLVLDFVNKAEDIQEAFAPYYEKTLLSQGTDPNLLYDLQTRLADFHCYSEDEVNHFAALYFDKKATPASPSTT